MDNESHHTSFAAAYVRATFPELADAAEDELWRAARERGLRLHRFKRTAGLPRVRRVLGALKGFAPTTLLDIGSGRGVFLWPLLDELPETRVTAVDRLALGIDPDDSQGRVVDVARQRAKEHLRAERSFVWNATNLSRRIRAGLIAMFAAYGARIRIVYVEAPEAELRARNAARAAPVPDRIVDRLLRRWTVPDLTEAHEIVIARAVR